MLRKRTRSHQKDQQMGHLTMSDSGSESYFRSDYHKPNSSSGLFVGLTPTGLSDCDSVRSPTSPLDFRGFSNLGNPNKCPGSPCNGGHHRSWDCSKVGLSIVDSLDDDAKGPGKVLRSSESKNILFGPQVRNKAPTFHSHTDFFEAPNSLPKNFALSHCTQNKSPLQNANSDVVFEIGESSFHPEPFGKIRSSSLNSCKSFSALSRFADMNHKVGSGNSSLFSVPTQVSSSGNSNTSIPVSVSNGSGFISGLSANEIELSEEYTCVISHGPNPKKTHIFGDCILEGPFNDLSNVSKNEGQVIKLPVAATTSTSPSPFPSNDFLGFCYYCHKKLEEGKDIYIYRGEKAFCSFGCRSQEIMIDEGLDDDEPIIPDSPNKADNGEDIFNTCLFYA